MKDMTLFIWDFDGTLLDTYPNITGYLRMALLDCGYDVSQTEILEKMLETIPFAIRYYSDLYQIPDLKARYDAYYVREATDPVSAFPKVKEVLLRVQKMGAANYIFTNRGVSIYPLLERAGILNEFQEIVTSADPNFVVKPAPDSIFYLMEKYGGTPENTVMIGDRCCDLESGYKAGCRTCHLLTEAVPQYPPCDWRIRNFEEMLKLLESK
ncbi:MAG: HAD-IA family hydrolase [Lachnospiraceae bacterium]|nr:HAD-IA family hydrolase [Lachnospiraceae bacterium]